MSESTDMIKVLKFKRFKLDLPPLIEGAEICSKNPYILHGAHPEHCCCIETEEVEMTLEKYEKLKSEEQVKYE